MTSVPKQFRISQLTTKWDEIFAAHSDKTSWTESESPRAAQEKVLIRYSSCVYDYLFGATQDHVITDELAQEFAYRFIRGDLSGAHPDKGRFRDYLKVALSNLVNDYHRRKKKNVQGTISEHLAVDRPFQEVETAFNEAWRAKVIQTAWENLKIFEQAKNNFFHTVLFLRANKPDKNSGELATLLSEQLKTSVTAEWVRQKLHRARQKFASLMIAEVKKTVATEEQLNEELAELRLLKYL